jgi:hypothetical protein
MLIRYNELRGGEKAAYIRNFERLAIAQLVGEKLEEKFSVVPKETQSRLQEIKERGVLRQLLRQAIRASSMEEFLKFMQN